MKKLVAVVLVATSFSFITPAAAGSGNSGASSDRRICTQVAQARAGSRMAPRRICRTAAQWREALGPDWRQHLAGARGLQDDYEALTARTSPDDASHGVQGLPIGSPGRPSPGPN